MNISVFGLGYVGCVSMGCLSKLNHRVIGVDISNHKVDLINQGKATIIENGIEELIKEGVNNGNLSATTDSALAVQDSDFSFICVGTPVSNTGEMNLSFVYSVAEEIGKALKTKDSYHIIAVRSTVPPGTCKKVSEIIEEQTGKSVGVHFGVISNPEFLREGVAVKDYFEPPVTVIGSNNKKDSDIAKNIYVTIEAPIVEVDVSVAEIIKFVNNTWHAVKITFANEVGNICKKLGVDSHSVMELFAMDSKLNLGKAYTKPGFAYGGSCLPKDLSGLVFLANNNHLSVPMISAVESSNESLKNRALELVLESGCRSVGMLGLSFKEGTDDLRLSPYVDLAEALIGKGIKLSIYDKNISYSNLMGINKAYINEHLKHINEILTSDLNFVVENSDIIIVSHKLDEYKNIPLKYPGKKFIELTKNIHKEAKLSNVEGINW